MMNSFGRSLELKAMPDRINAIKHHIKVIVSDVAAAADALAL
jgi:hypothetical protein